MSDFYAEIKEIRNGFVVKTNRSGENFEKTVGQALARVRREHNAFTRSVLR